MAIWKVQIIGRKEIEINSLASPRDNHCRPGLVCMDVKDWFQEGRMCTLHADSPTDCKPGQLHGAIWELWQVNGDRRIGDKGQNLKYTAPTGKLLFFSQHSQPGLQTSETQRWAQVGARRAAGEERGWGKPHLSSPSLSSTQTCGSRSLQTLESLRDVGEPCCFVSLTSCSLVPDMGWSQEMTKAPGFWLEDWGEPQQLESTQGRLWRGRSSEKWPKWFMNFGAQHWAVRAWFWPWATCQRLWQLK